MLRMVSYPRRPKSAHITCYLNRTYHLLPTRFESLLDLLRSVNQTHRYLDTECAVHGSIRSADTQSREKTLRCSDPFSLYNATRERDETSQLVRPPFVRFDGCI